MIKVNDPELCSKFFGSDLVEKKVKRAAEKNAPAMHTPPPSRLATNERGTPPSIPRTPSGVYRTREWLSMKARRNVMLLPPDPELDQVKKECSIINENEQLLLQDLEAFLETESSHKQCKKEMLYKQWSERVFDPIYSALKSNMESNGPLIDAQRREIFDKYLNTAHKKEVFLDTIDVSEYDPLLLTANAVPATIQQPLNDPLTMQHIDHHLEQQVITSCDVGVVRKGHGLGVVRKEQAYGRQDTDSVLWLAMHLAQIDSKTRQRTQRKITGTKNQSHFDNGLKILVSKKQ